MTQTLADIIASGLQEPSVAAILYPTSMVDGSTMSIYIGNGRGLRKSLSNVFDGTHYFVPCIKTVPSITDTLQLFMGSNSSLCTYGDMELNINSTRKIINGLTWDEVLSTYSFRGNPFDLLVGFPDWDWAEWMPIMTQGVMDTPVCTRSTMTIPIWGRARKYFDMTVPTREYSNQCFTPWSASTGITTLKAISPTTDNGHWYLATAGTPGTTGASEPSWGTTNGGTTADNGITWTCCEIPEGTQGKKIPWVFGTVYNYEPDLVDETSHIYCTCDVQDMTKLESVDAVYWDGVLKTLTTHYTVSFHNDILKMGSDPGGTVTIDAKGKQQYRGGVATCQGLADVFVALLTMAGVSVGDISATLIQEFQNSSMWPVGLVLNGNGAKLSASLDALFLGTNCAWFHDRVGLWNAIHVVDPDTRSTYDLELDEKRVTNLSQTFDERLYYKTTMGFKRNWSPMEVTATSVTEADRTWFAEEYSTVVVEDSSIQTLFPETALEYGPNETCLQTEGDAQAICTECQTLFGKTRRIITCTVNRRGLNTSLGKYVWLTYPRFGLDNGKGFVIVGTEDNPTSGTTILTLWG